VAGTALVRTPRNRHRNTVIQRVGLRIVGTGVPGRATIAAFHRDIAPGLVAEFALTRASIGAPEFFAARHVVRRDPATAGIVVIAARHAGNDLAVSDDRTTRIVVAHLPVAHLVLPGDLTGLDVERDEEGVMGRHDQLVFVKHGVAVAAGQRSGV